MRKVGSGGGVTIHKIMLQYNTCAQYIYIHMCVYIYISYTFSFEYTFTYTMWLKGTVKVYHI